MRKETRACPRKCACVCVHARDNSMGVVGVTVDTEGRYFSDTPIDLLYLLG